MVSREKETLGERLGATALADGRCQFLVWAPRAKSVEVCIERPEKRRVAMEPDECGYFRAIAESVRPGTDYKYRLDGDKERPDPASRYQPDGVHGASRVIGDNFAWADSAWKGIPIEKYVFYELHVGAFSPEGTFDAITPRIAALKELGITAIEMMPIAQFPGERNWGYDGVYPYAVQASYGGPEGLKQLVDACHQEGMAVALDVVYNHLGPEGNYLGDFGPYFTNVYKTPWGDAINFDEPESDHVRRYFIENALQWITDFHVDALRLDATHAIVDASAQTFLEDLSATVHARAAELGRQVFLIPESHRNDARLISPPEIGGAGYDGVWNDDFHHSLHVLLTGERKGYYEDFGSVEDLAKCYREGFLYSGQYAPFWRRRRGNSSKEVPATRFVVYSQNHDQIGNRREGDRLSEIVSLEKLKVAAAAVLLAPNIPLLFMGEEYGETAPFQYFVSHSDEALIEAVRKGRKEEFAQFSWEGETPDPQSEETFRRSKLNWELQEAGDHRTLREFYRELLRLRRDIPALEALEKDSMRVTTLEGKVLLIERWSGTSRVVVGFHFGDAATEFVLPIATGRWKKLLDSAEPRWHGPGTPLPELIESRGDSARLPIAPWTVFVLAQNT
jgi:maltooligosyltrehalose trehalohydrolase